MKNLKRISSLVLGFLIVMAFTLASCQKEDLNLEHSSHAKIKPELKIVKLTNKDITQNKGITNKLNFFTETLKTRQQNKTVYSSEHDFYINTDFATYIEKANGSHSYTFPVQYANETGEINNLVLHSQDDGTYNTLYVSYDVTENEKALINNGMPVNLEGKISVALIDDAIFIDSLFSKVTTTDQCLTPMYSLGACDAGSTYWHDPEPFSDGNGMCSGSQLTLVNVSTNMDCLNAADTGSPGSDGTSSTGDTGNPNGGGLNFDPNDPITTPVTCEGCLEVDDECFVSDEDYNAPFSANSPFTVDLGEVRKSCDSISLPANEKFLCIYEKLTSSPKFKDLFIDTFGESINLNVTFKVVPTIAPIPPSTNSPNGTTSGISTSSNNSIVTYNAIIKINQAKMEANSALSVAKTILHESLHAFLKIKMHGCNQGTELDEYDDVELSEILNQYHITACANQSDHEFMFDYLIPTMSEILADIKDDLVPLNHQAGAESTMLIDESNPTGPEVPWDWNEFYKYLSMAGLHGTNAFANNIENSPSKFSNFEEYVGMGTNSFRKACVN